MFGSRKKIYVSSVIYNMAGNYDERNDYLKYLVLTGVLASDGRTVGEVISSGTLNGPRMNYQTFFRWAKNNYPEGMPVGGVFGSSPIDPELVNPYIPVTAGFTADAELVSLDFADYWNWAEAYVMEHHPELINTEWDADINEATGEISILFEDHTLEEFMPVNYDKSGKYIYARYSEVQPPVDPDPQFVSAGEDQGPFDYESELPSTSGHYLVSEVDEFGVTQNRHQIVVAVSTYSDSRPSETVETKTVIGSRTYDRLVQTFERYVSLRADTVNEARSWWDLSRVVVWEAPAYEVVWDGETTDVVEIEPGVFRTTVTTTYREDFLSSGSKWWGREEVWEKDNGIKGMPKLFIYKIGDGVTELDALDETVTPMDGFFPMIPIRTNNKMIDEEPHLTNIYPQAKKAWKRASGGKKIEKLIEDVADNPDLGDIDYSFLVWGVPLNSITREAKLYIYKFFRTMMDQQKHTPEEFAEFLADDAAYKDYLDAFEVWQNSGEEGGAPQTAPPVAPSRPKISFPPLTTIRTNGQHPETAHYDFQLSFSLITETIHAGKWKEDARKNEVKIEKGPDYETSTSFIGLVSSIFARTGTTHNTMYIYWQENDDQYRILTVIGARHKNVVYGGKSVDITSSEALDDGDDSGFLVPMHYSILKSMPIVWANQLATEGLIIVFNCYVIVKKKWYQTFLGFLLIVVVIVVATAIFTGGASLAGGGILGSNAAVGAMFGVSGMTGALLGAIANAVVAAIVSQIVSTVLAKFGPIGQILAAVFGIVMGGIQSGAFSNGFSFDIFLRADNLLRLTNAFVSAYTMHIQLKTADIYTRMADLEEAYKRQKREIDELMYELTGFSSGFDPMALTEILNGRFESRDAFNQRTLMTGSDIAELSHGLIEHYVDSSLDLENLKE